MLTVEVGGSSTQAIQFAHPARGEIVNLDQHRTAPWLLAAPGLVEGDRIRGAHHLNWLDVRASEELRMASAPLLGMNDAEAAALGEWCLLGQPSGTLLYIGLGTGVGVAAVAHGKPLPVNFSHRTTFGPARCGGCGNVGCLDAQIGGHTLPTPLHQADIASVIATLTAAIKQQEITIDRIVVGGGMARHYPAIVSGLQERIGPSVLPSASPNAYKSAAPFGLLHTWQTRQGLSSNYNSNDS